MAPEPPSAEFTVAYTPQPAQALPGEIIGTRIGPYQLLQLLGEGGMGTVYVAEQIERVKRRVALKLVKPGMDSAQVLRRFEAERQALALMDHPNVAKVLDAGTTDSGRPYFVMELVLGVPITRYCDKLQLSIRQRLELFMPVCQAIEHAHQKGIIHRDIKPSNVLVCIQDGLPVSKVIDFGVAKALHERLTDATMYTEIGAVIGTLEYMSPEQAEVSPLGVDTRADVYALGVLLYELLTGTTPLDRKRLRNAGLTERMRIIKEEEPPRPSTRLSDSKESLAELAARRRTEPGRLTRDVRGELDWIIMKCLEKDRTCRYDSASALEGDIEHYLRDEPVEACPPTRRYRLRKFLRRNKTLVSALALLFLILLGGIGGTTWGMVQAERERDDKGRILEAEKKARARTREALDEMSSGVIEDWLSRQPHQTPEQKRFLEKTARFYEEFAAAGGEDESTLAEVADARRRLATIHFTLGRYPQAARSAEQAAGLFRQLANRNRAEQRYQVGLILALNEQARAMMDAFRKTEEIDFVELEAIAVADGVIAGSPNDLSALEHLTNSLCTRGYHLTYRGRSADALIVLQRAFPLQERLRAAEPGNDLRRANLARIRNYRMDCLYALGRDVEAEQDRVAALHSYEDIARRSSVLSSARTRAGFMRLNTGIALGKRGRFAEAMVEYRKAEEWFTPLTANYPGIAQYRSNLAALQVSWARTLVDAKDWSAAHEQAARAFATWKELGYFGPAAGALAVLADCRCHAGKVDQAVHDHTTAIQWINDSVAQSGHTAFTRMDLAAAHAGRAAAWQRLRKYPEALADWDKAIDCARAPGPEATHVAPSAYNLFKGKAETLTRTGRFADAEAALRKLLTVAEKSENDSFATFHVKSLLGAALLHQRRYIDAEPFLVQGYQGMKARAAKAPPECKAQLTESLGNSCNSTMPGPARTRRPGGAKSGAR